MERGKIRKTKQDHPTPLSPQNTHTQQEELWTLLNFAAAEHFPDKAEFEEAYGDIKDQAQLQKLQEAIRPFLLRRMKEDVEKNLPPKEETIIDGADACGCMVLVCEGRGGGGGLWCGSGFGTRWVIRESEGATPATISSIDGRTYTPRCPFNTRTHTHTHIHTHTHASTSTPPLPPFRQWR
jgi:hypothetical protein